MNTPSFYFFEGISGGRYQKGINEGISGVYKNSGGAASEIREQ